LNAYLNASGLDTADRSAFIVRSRRTGGGALTLGSLFRVDSASTTGLFRIGPSGHVHIIDGTAASPGLTFGNDTNNGIYRIGADDWALAVNGYAGIRLTSSLIQFGAPLSMDGAGIIGDRNQLIAVATTRALNTTQDPGRSFSNTGATSEAIIDLPSATNGFNFRFSCTAAQYIRIRVPAWEPTSVIRNGASVSVAGGYIRSNVVGSTLRLECFKDGEWSVTDERGTWTIDS